MFVFLASNVKTSLPFTQNYAEILYKYTLSTNKLICCKYISDQNITLKEGERRL
jgi:hypothetical protein